MSAAVIAGITPTHGQSFAMSNDCCGLSGASDGTTITYNFAGTLAESFGTLGVGAPFTGPFSYAIAQPDLDAGSGSPGARGQYHYQSLSLTIGGTTVTDNNPGSGRIFVYDHGTYGTGGYTYPTDFLNVVAFNSNLGSLGGLTLGGSTGISLVLQDLTGTAWSSTALPGAGLTMANLTIGGATHLQLQSPLGGFGFSGTTSRGPLDACAVPEPSEYAAIAGMALVAFGAWRRARRRPALHGRTLEPRAQSLFEKSACVDGARLWRREKRVVGA